MSSNATKKPPSEASFDAHDTLTQNSTNSSFRVNRPSARQNMQGLSSTVIKDGRSPLHMDPVLPEDDLSMFFRSRAIASKGTTTSWYALLRLVLVTALIFLMFVGLYNGHPKFRAFANSQSQIWLNVPLDKYVPYVTKLRGERIQGAAALAKVGSAKDISLEPFSQVKHRSWKSLEDQLRGRCASWQATSDCAVKAFYVASRGLFNAGEGMLRVPDEQVAALKANERLSWHLSAAIILQGKDEAYARFRKALAVTSVEASEARRFVFDELIVANAVAKRTKQVHFYLQEALKDPNVAFWGPSVAKWQSLESVISSDAGVIPKDIALDLMARERGTLRNDARALILLGPPFIRAGLAEHIVKPMADGVIQLMQSNADETLSGRLLMMHVRVLWAMGKRQDAVAILSRHHKFMSRIPASKHFLVAALLQQSSRAELMGKASNVLPPLTTDTPWESQYLLGLTYVRLGNYQKAVPIIQTLTIVKGDRSKAKWARLLNAEQLMGLHDHGEATKLLEPLTKGPNPSAYAQELLYKCYVARGRVHEAEVIRRKIDDAKSKLGYWSSPEMLTSPLGPLALLR